MTQIPAGWYPDPAQTHRARQRYWDGARWTEHVHDPQPPAYPTYPAYPSYPEGIGTPYAPVPAPGYAPAVVRPRTTPDGQPLSGWWRRVLAQILDGLILTPVAIGLFAAVIASHWHEISTWFHEVSRATDAGTNPPSAPAVFQPWSPELLGFAAAYAVVLAVYTLGFWRWKQATPGKLIVGIRIRRRDAPGPMPWSTMVVRFAFVEALAFAAYLPWVGILFALAGLLDYLWPLWDSRNQALHDKVARTNVVLAPPSEHRSTTAELSAAGLPPRW